MTTVRNINIGIREENLKKINEILEIILADELLMYVKIKNFHWNVVGVNFVEYHKFLDELAEESQETGDEVAERMRSLGVKVNATMKNYLAKGSVKEVESLDLTAAAMMEVLLDDYEKNIQALRVAIDKTEALEDAGTADFLTSILEAKEKKAWMLRSMLA